MDNDFAARIQELCASAARVGTACRIAARTASESVFKVVLAETNLKDAAISLGQEEELCRLIDELYGVAKALRTCSGDAGTPVSQPPARNSSKKSTKPALPQWWYALSEMLQTTEREIELLSSIGRAQSRHSEGRQVCSLTIRVLRKHYHTMFAGAEEWMSMADG